MRKEINVSSCLSGSRSDDVDPVAMKLVTLHIKMLHFFIANLASDWIFPAIQSTRHFQSLRRRSLCELIPLFIYDALGPTTVAFHPRASSKQYKAANRSDGFQLASPTPQFDHRKTGSGTPILRRPLSSFNPIACSARAAPVIPAIARTDGAHAWRKRRSGARAERRAGEMLAEMAQSGERATRGKPGETSQPATLSDLGISRDQSSRWQKLAQVPAICSQRIGNSIRPCPHAVSSQWSFFMFGRPGRACTMQLMSCRGPCYRETTEVGADGRARVAGGRPRLLVGAVWRGRPPANYWNGRSTT